MDVRFSCHNCGQHIDAPEEMAGQGVNCPGCQQSLTVPNRSTVPVESQPEATDISFDCAKCGQNIVIDEAWAGQLYDCPKCGTKIVVPDKSQPSATSNTPATDTLSDNTSPPVSTADPVIIYVDSSPQKPGCIVTGYARLSSGKNTQWYIDNRGHWEIDSSQLSDSDMREFLDALNKHPQVPKPINDDYLTGNPSAVKFSDYKVGEQSPTPATDTLGEFDWHPPAGATSNTPTTTATDKKSAVWLIGLILLWGCCGLLHNIFNVNIEPVYIVVVAGIVVGIVLLRRAARGMMRRNIILLKAIAVIALLISPIVIAVILTSFDVNPYLLAKLWRQATNILQIDSLAGTIGLTGKWVKEGSDDKAVYLEFFSDKTLTLHTAKTPIAGKWIVLSDGRIKYALALPLGATGTFLCDLEGQTLIIDVDGNKVRYVRM